jgi:hypothetical protein
MTPNRRQRWLGGALVATLGATAFTAWWSDPADGLAEPLAPRSRSGAMPRAAADPGAGTAMPPPAADARGAATAAVPPQPRAAWAAVDAAALAAWGHAPVLPRRAPPNAARAAAAASAAPPPQAPPLAYRYVGRVIEDGRRRAMLVSPKQSILVEEHELIEGQWRVEHIGDAEIRWLWLPGALPGRLAFAS